MPKKKEHNIPLVGEIDDCGKDIIEKLLEIPQGSHVTLWIDCYGGSSNLAIAVAATLRLRKHKATGIVVGTCDSAALVIFAACAVRKAIPHASFLFHRSQHDQNDPVNPTIATEWARYFAWHECDMDKLTIRLFNGAKVDKVYSQIASWLNGHKYATAKEMADIGLLEIINPFHVPIKE
jgi:ATP-dependent protease ClpP protease subunit